MDRGSRRVSFRHRTINGLKDLPGDGDLNPRLRERPSQKDGTTVISAASCRSSGNKRKPRQDSDTEMGIIISEREEGGKEEDGKEEDGDDDDEEEYLQSLPPSQKPPNDVPRKVRTAMAKKSPTVKKTIKQQKLPSIPKTDLAMKRSNGKQNRPPKAAKLSSSLSSSSSSISEEEAEVAEALCCLAKVVVIPSPILSPIPEAISENTPSPVSSLATVSPLAQPGFSSPNSLIMPPESEALKGKHCQIVQPNNVEDIAYDEIVNGITEPTEAVPTHANDNVTNPHSDAGHKKNLAIGEPCDANVRELRSGIERSPCSNLSCENKITNTKPESRERQPQSPADCLVKHEYIDLMMAPPVESTTTAQGSEKSEDAANLVDANGRVEKDSSMKNLWIMTEKNSGHAAKTHIVGDTQYFFGAREQKVGMDNKEIHMERAEYNNDTKREDMDTELLLKQLSHKALKAAKTDSKTSKAERSGAAASSSQIITASSLPLLSNSNSSPNPSMPTGMAEWPASMLPFGRSYCSPTTPMSMKDNIKPCSVQVPPFLLPAIGKKIWKRCERHVYIAHFTELQQQIQRHPMLAATYNNNNNNATSGSSRKPFIPVYPIPPMANSRNSAFPFLYPNNNNNNSSSNNKNNNNCNNNSNNPSYYYSISAKKSAKPGDDGRGGMAMVNSASSIVAKQPPQSQNALSFPIVPEEGCMVARGKAKGGLPSQAQVSPARRLRGSIGASQSTERALYHTQESSSSALSQLYCSQQAQTSQLPVSSSTVDNKPLIQTNNPNSFLQQQQQQFFQAHHYIQQHSSQPLLNGQMSQMNQPLSALFAKAPANKNSSNSSARVMPARRAASPLHGRSPPFTEAVGPHQNRFGGGGPPLFVHSQSNAAILSTGTHNNYEQAKKSSLGESQSMSMDEKVLHIPPIAVVGGVTKHISRNLLHQQAMVGSQ